MMILRPSLPLKISLLAFFNIALLAVVFVVFVQVQFRLDLSSFLFAPARDRILSASRLLALQLPQEPESQWNQSLNLYSKTYSAQLYLFASRGVQLAGEPTALPDDVQSSLTRGHRGPQAQGEHRRMPPMLGPPIFLIRSAHSRDYWVGVPIPISRGPRVEPLHGAVIWRFSSIWTNPFFFDYRPWLVVILAIVLISVACWLPLIRGLTRAISQMTRATAQIAEGHFEIALSTQRRDELGYLSGSINRMAHRLADLIQGQRRFLSDIAHELCSPIARMQVALGILEQRASPNTSGYVKDVSDELTHVAGLIDELLSFSRAELGPANVELKPVNIAEVAQRVLERESPSPARIENRIKADLNVMAQPDYLYRSLANLVRNALRYAGAAGAISLSANNGEGQISIRVTDDGPGLPESELENVFKPFYRPEFARQRETGGVGLGLAIVKSCVEACGGAVRCRNRLPHGLEVEMIFRAAG